MDADILVEDLFDVVDTVARMVGGAVVVEDVDFRVLAYSTVPDQCDDEARRAAILSRRTPDQWLRWMDDSGFREKLLASEDVVRLDIPWPTAYDRYVQPIRAGAEIVGFIWLMEGETPLAANFAGVAKDMAVLLAPELSRRSRAFTENPGGQLLRQFLAGGLPASRVADHLEVDELTVPTIVIAFDVPADAIMSTSSAVAVRTRAVRALSLHAELHLRGCLVGSVDQQIYLLHADPSLATDAVDRLLDRAVQHVDRALGAPVRATAGRVHRGLRAAERSRREADDAMRVLRARPGGPNTGTFDRLRHTIVLHEVVELLRGRPALVEGIIEPLADHDRLRGTEYVRTLSVYLGAFGDVRAAAALLHVHPNSLRYRIRRLEEMGGLDLADGELRLALQLVLAARGPARPAESRQP